MRERESGDYDDQLSKSPDRNDETEHEQQVLDAVQNVLETQHDEPPRGLMPAWIETHGTGVAEVFECAYRPARRQKAHDRDDPDAEPDQVGIDREIRLLG